MIFFHIKKTRFSLTLFILLIELQISACSTDNGISAATDNAEQNKQTINETNTNNVTMSGGISNGTVIEDDDPDNNNLLEVSGKLSITNLGADNTNFIANSINGTYGSLIIDTIGNWNYAADNTQSVIQNLAAGARLTDNLIVSSVDGTTHTVIITILGVDEIVTNSPAIINGVNTGSVTEDTDPNNNNLLKVNAKLNITDPDAGEAAFIASTLNGAYGNLIINAAGNWRYTADNTQSVIQNLATGTTLTDSLIVSSVDGTTHTVIITILGVDEINNNTPAIISGTNTGSVTEDVAPNNNNLLEVGAKLNITDPDAGEAAFIANTINGAYGNLTINTAGNWNYAADNTQSIIQNLATNATLTDILIVSSIDGTVHAIIITIFGADENTTTPNITLSWVAPVAREDNSPLSLSAIAGYKIYYGTTPGQYPNSTSINDGSATGYVFNNFTSATYYFVVTTIDTDGRESQYSTEITISI